MPIAFSFLLATVAYLKFSTSVPVLIVPGRVSEGMSYMVLPRNGVAPIWRIFPGFSAGSADGVPVGGLTIWPDIHSRYQFKPQTGQIALMFQPICRRCPIFAAADLENRP